MIDTKLLQWATPSEAEMLEAVNLHGSYRKAATALNSHHSTISRIMDRLTLRAATQGYSPEHDLQHTVPDPFYVKGISSLYDGEGNLKAQWIKSNVNKDRQFQQMKEAVQDWAENLRDRAPLTIAPKSSEKELLAVYPMGDPHFGLYAYAQESGEDFDLKVAEEVTCKAIDRLVTSAPAAGTGLLLNLGDAFHADDSTNQTPASGNPLDVDTRFAKVAQVGLRALVHCVHRLLEKHENVVVWNMVGNHDPHSALWLSLCMDAFFNSEPRVTIDLSPSLYKFYRFGKVLLGAHHGHGAKSNDLPLLMAADRPEDWGQTEFRHWLCGHIHHWTAKEHPGVVVETFRTLAAKDAWHAGKGYRSRRDMNCIVYHMNFGEIHRIRCDIAMLTSQ
jgi:hypothetical protein